MRGGTELISSLQLAFIVQGDSSYNPSTFRGKLHLDSNFNIVDTKV